MIDKSYIEKEFLELQKIKNKSFEKGVIKVWILGCKKGGWERIDDIPFTLLIPTEISLIEHTRRVTQMAISIAEKRKDLDMDILIAGALTHDVGKLLEYTRGNADKHGCRHRGTRKVIKSELGKRVRHPVSGYELALIAGLPQEVAHIIFAHSHEGDKIERSPEAIVVHHCDFIEFEIAKTI
ncbi:HD domain-containing protein [candidate division WOR-3 bacterium]|nr:HD domain-containing protein [candidate division WOR-3 bacterium]